MSKQNYSLSTIRSIEQTYSLLMCPFGVSDHKNKTTLLYFILTMYVYFVHYTMLKNFSIFFLMNFIVLKVVSEFDFTLTKVTVNGAVGSCTYGEFKIIQSFIKSLSAS